MHTLGMKRVVMLTPFDESMDLQLVEYVGHAGIDVVAHRSLWPSDEAAMSRRYGVSTMPLAEPYHAAKELYLSTPGADGIWITGALMPSVAIIDSLEQDLEHPRGDQHAGHDVGRSRPGTGQGRSRGLRPAVRPRLRSEIVSFPGVCRQTGPSIPCFTG